MKIICSKENLTKAMNIVSRAVPSRTTMEILKCVLIQAEDQKIKLIANDTSLGIETMIDAVVKEPGTIAIDAALFSSIVRKLPDSDVIIETDANDAISISCETANFKLSGRGTDDFIYLPLINADEPVIISQNTLREMISQVIFSISDSDSNAAMSGVYIEIFDNKIRMTTLDGHRISIRTNTLDKNYSRVSAIVPGKTMSDVSKILSNDDSDMQILFSNNHIVFNYDETKVVSRLIDGDYFKIDSMLSVKYETSIHMNKRELMDCLDRSILLVNESDKKPVIMTITDEEMVLKLKSAIGSMNESIEIKKEGPDIKIAFNPKLLLDSLRVIEDEEIDIYMVKYNYPCTIRDNDGKYNYVVLPVNFTED